MKDFYRVLECGYDATPDQIKTNYRRLARQYHPDRNHDNPVAERRFKEINEAYSTLSDSQKKIEYDMERTWQTHNKSTRRAEKQPEANGAYRQGPRATKEPQNGRFGSFMNDVMWNQVRGFASGMAQAVVNELQNEIEEDATDVDQFVLDTVRLSARKNPSGSISLSINISPENLKKITEFASRGMDIDDYCADVGVYLAEELSNQIMEHWRGY
jgi:curved DNA-binding protein CbpA